MAEDIGNIYKTKIPSYAEAADIQAALKLFHYGTTTVPTDEDDILQDSLAGHLKDLQDQVTLIETVGIGSDFLTIAQIGSLTNPQDGYIAMASDSSGSPITTTYATAIYQNEAPTEDLVDGLVWVDKDSSPRRAYIYNEGNSSWDIIDDIQSVVNNAGDILYGTSNDTISVLPIGTAGQVLQVNSGATAPEWATPSSGGMTLLATLTLTGSSVTSSTFSSAYKQLFVYYKGVYLNSGQDLNMRLNADTGSNYYYRNMVASDGVVNSYEGQAATSWRFGGVDTSSTSYNTVNGFVTIMNPSDTDWVFGVNSHYRNGSSGTDVQNWNNTLLYDSSAAITSVTILTGATFSGGTAYVYGVN